MKYLVYTLAIILGYSQSLIAQAPAELKSWLPEVSGWVVADKVEVFNPDNLFDRINGAAPLFIENNFREMTALEYTKGNDYITIQCYRHASPEDAFGMYASERSSDLTFFPIGGEAQGDNSSVYFFAGNIYVKMWTTASGDVGNVLKSIAGGLAQKIDSNAGYPPIVKAFPNADKELYTEAYITSSYIGHEFLSSVFTAKYKKNNQFFQAFIIDGKTAEGAKEVLNKYFTFTKQPLEFQQGKLIVNDRYNGDVPVLWKGKYLIGIFSESGNMMANSDSFLEEIANSLP